MTAMKERVHVVLAAGGAGSRMGAGQNKIFLEAGGKSILLRSMQLFEGIIDRMVIVCRPEDEQQIRRIVSMSGVSYQVSLARGGESRQHSVLNGLKSLGADPDDIVLVHDAARCLTPVNVILDILESCRSKGSGVAAVPAVNTMKYADSDMYVLHTADRSDLYEIQTPQGFRFAQLYDSYIKAEKDGFVATDDASVAEHAGVRVLLVRGSKKNIKVTEKEDLVMINALLQQDTPSFRIGMGYDVHRLTEGRKLILCGIDLLLKEAIRKVRKAGYEFVNADIPIAAQKPRISPYIPEMVRKVSETLSCDTSQVNIKATTTERLGFEGREEGISAQAVCSLLKL